MSPSPPDPREPVVALTDGAIELLRRFAGERRLESLYVLVAVQPDGDGFRYFVDFGEPEPADIAYSWKGVRLQIDRASAPYLHGTVIDVDQSAGGQVGFKFNNPNVRPSAVR